MHDLARVVDALVNVEIILVIVRVSASWFPNIDPWHPWMKALRLVTDPVLRPFRHVLPSFAGIDVTPVLAIVVLRALDRALSLYIDSIGVDVLQLLFYVVEQVLLAVVAIFAIIVFIRMVMSMLRPDPYHPTVRLLREVSRPLVEPFTAVVPRSRRVDAPAVVAFVTYVVAYLVIQAVLDRLIERL